MKNKKKAAVIHKGRRQGEVLSLNAIYSAAVLQALEWSADSHRGAAQTVHPNGMFNQTSLLGSKTNQQLPNTDI